MIVNLERHVIGAVLLVLLQRRAKQRKTDEYFQKELVDWFGLKTVRPAHRAKP